MHQITTTNAIQNVNAVATAEIRTAVVVGRDDLHQRKHLGLGKPLDQAMPTSGSMDPGYQSGSMSEASWRGRSSELCRHARPVCFGSDAPAVAWASFVISTRMQSA